MNLIICCTPLQVLIAEKIIDLNPKEKFIGLFVANEKNEKHNTYYNKFKEKCERCFWINEAHTFTYKEYFSYWLKWKIKLLFLNPKKIFLANVEKIFVRTVISTFPKVPLYTFDDGIRNLTSAGREEVFISYPSRFGKRRSFKSNLARILGLKYGGNLIRERIVKHYTLFSNQKNIVENTQAIRLISEQKPWIDSRDNFNILIGQPIYEYIYENNNKSKEITEKIINIYGISHYFPHPREDYHIENAEYINTPLIFEDYFIQHLADKNVTVYTFFSTVALSVCSLSNVKVISIKPKDIDVESYLECYEIFQKMGIEVIDYDG